ncbi:MAG: hypothetical protein LBJ00_09120 [Planctomycetaceae bacterium]|nr:hypothetical protein [Planctomycetaceae bacterium]
MNNRFTLLRLPNALRCRFTVASVCRNFVLNVHRVHLPKNFFWAQR